MIDSIEQIVIPHLRTVTERPELVGAIKTKLGEYEVLKARIAELEQATQKRKLPDKYDPSQFSDAEDEEILKLASDLEELKKSRHQLVLLQDVFIAQYFFTRNLQREEIIKELKEWPPDRKIDITISWGWINAHHMLIKENSNVDLYKPYQCEVGPASAKSRTRHNVDREFWVLRHFIHPFNQQIDDDFNFFEKRERPDFLLMNSTNEVLGMEITDAHIDENWAKNHGIRTDILRDLNDIHDLPPLVMTGSCDIGHYWQDHQQEVYQVFANEIAPYYHNSAQSRKEWELFGLFIEVLPKKYIGLRMDPENRPYGGDYFEKVNADAIIYKIMEKLRGRAPEIWPSILVVQPIVDLPIEDHEAVIQKVKNELTGICFSPKYDEIWYLYNEKGYRLLP